MKCLAPGCRVIVAYIQELVAWLEQGAGEQRKERGFHGRHRSHLRPGGWQHPIRQYRPEPSPRRDWLDLDRPFVAENSLNTEANSCSGTLLNRSLYSR